MRFLADENVPFRSIRRLRDAGHEVAAIREDTPGIEDPEILVRVREEERVLLTFDRDFGELVYHLGQLPPLDVVYFRLSPVLPLEPAEHLLQVLAVPGLSLERMYTIIERDRVRQRPLPSA